VVKKRALSPKKKGVRGGVGPLKRGKNALGGRSRKKGRGLLCETSSGGGGNSSFKKKRKVARPRVKVPGMKVECAVVKTQVQGF